MQGNIGSKYLLKRIMQIKPKMHVFGHVHHDHGIAYVNDTTFVNACNHRWLWKACEKNPYPRQHPLIFDL